MTKRISELPNVSTTTNDDLLELAQVDFNSPTGYSSRSIRVGDLPSNESSSRCRYVVDEVVTLAPYPSAEYATTFTFIIPENQITPCVAGNGTLGVDGHFGTLRMSLSAVIDSSALPTDTERFIYFGDIQFATSTGFSPLNQSEPYFGGGVYRPYSLSFDNVYYWQGQGLQLTFRISENPNYVSFPPPYINAGTEVSLLGVIDFTFASSNTSYY